MFEKIRYQLLLYYLAILVSILGTFTVAVRVVFTQSLKKQTVEKLTALGQGAAANVEVEKGKIQVTSDLYSKTLIDGDHALEWFDIQGNVIAKQGKYILKLPLPGKDKVQIQTGKKRVEGVTLPVINSENGQVVGYVRASQSLEEFDENINKLDLGLGGGIVLALVLSSVGGVILTSKAMQPIEESFQRLKQFTADASHELRSPLMAIKSNAAVALKYAEGMRESDAKKFQAIASATNQMTSLTEDLLLLARADQILTPKRDTVNLTEILNNLVQLDQSQAQTKQINLKADLKGSLYLLGDTVQITRLFANLIDNALQYTSVGGSVEVQARQTGAYLYINVKDTGIGIAPEHLQQVFERFWRADQARSYRDGGSGLGLAIAQSIVHNHGGLITVTSQMGVGSCFTVRLPADQPL
ncbi:MAG: HAMP domain-containing histidine kinase [Stigonema ocellatum SAG 48.90 = DSM 106950]|nr:HAMP domain-containing histidine kinase [Stigonema ocellatum SAG 48.90 = DSM 106950]